MKTKLTIAVGTQSEQKIGYLKEILAEIGIGADIIPTKVESRVSEQPLTQAETSKGSLNRAKEALAKNPSADFGLGIEIGYQLNKEGKFDIFCCASIIDKKNYRRTCLSSKFILPEFHQNILKQEKYLGEYVRKYKENIDEPVVNYIRELVRSRKPLIIEATRNALLSYLENNKY